MNLAEAKRYVADRDVVDSIKLEVSAIDPQFEGMVREVVPQIVKVCVDNYYPYLTLEALEKAKTLADRIVVTDKETFSLLRDTWREDWKEEDEDKVENDGVRMFIGDIILLKAPSNLEYAWGKFSDAIKQENIRNFKSEEGAKRELGLRRFEFVLIHEIIHGFHPNDSERMSHLFSENGVCYYTREIANQLRVQNFSLRDELRADVHADFVRQSPEIVHRVFFGSETGKGATLVNEAYREYIFQRFPLAREGAYKAPEKT